MNDLDSSFQRIEVVKFCDHVQIIYMTCISCLQLVSCQWWNCSILFSPFHSHDLINNSPSSELFIASAILYHELLELILTNSFSETTTISATSLLKTSGMVFDVIMGIIIIIIITFVMIHQIFLLEPYWSKCITWPSDP